MQKYNFTLFVKNQLNWGQVYKPIPNLTDFSILESYLITKHNTAIIMPITTLYIAKTLKLPFFR